MSTVQAFRRPDGTVGIRNHLFILPAVVCANQVAIDVARRNPALKYIEHQHGCGQMGADLIQTQRVFTHLAQHPNVYGSIFVGLGCEGIVAKDLFARAHSQSDKPMDLVIIQQSGGTLGAESACEEWIEARSQEVKHQVRTETAWDEISVGVLFDEVSGEQAETVDAALAALWELGVKLILPGSQTERAARLGQAEAIDHGEKAFSRLALMKEGSNALETLTGLTAAGAHLTVHLANRAHAFGNPVTPLVRWSISPASYRQYRDDFDGQLQDELDIPRLLEQLLRIVNGQESIAEELGMDDFALYRIGPTV
ncbi:UxaA family hydrolase [Alicyclobacillus tolerans]|uniref:UxaA family hydrolase n=1 Tax=Alicyclobacillus tolerans TaxID=90970 RepID=UPI001F438C7F|nr:UxaA family hydrolase [Alicyclobacillus tolerans]MCF8565835.1 UxaA family hydrolase [Alicyclobacillus tolerans]